MFLYRAREISHFWLLLRNLLLGRLKKEKLRLLADYQSALAVDVEVGGGAREQGLRLFAALSEHSAVAKLDVLLGAGLNLLKL